MTAYASELEPGPRAPLDIAGHAMCCEALWIAALKVYFVDAKSALKGFKHSDPEALEDLLGSQTLLKNLCRPLDVDPQRVGGAMLDALDAGRRWG